MAKIKKRATPAPDPKTTRDKPAATSRHRGISSAPAATKHGKNHKLTLKHRSVVRYLMSPSKLNMSPTEASNVFNYIFPKRSLTPKMLREDWATRKNRKGGNMYIDRIIKRAGTYTREEIVAIEEAIAKIYSACDKLDIEIPDDVEMEDDLGDPTDATVLHPTAPLSRLPRGTIDGENLPIGYQPRTDDYVDSRTLWHEDDRSFRRRVMVCPGKGVHTRRQVNQSVLRTPSVEPRVVRNSFVPVASGYSDDSDLEGQAEERRIARTQAAPDEQYRYAQEQARRDQERQKRGIVPQAPEGRLINGRMRRIIEEAEEEDGNERNNEEEDAGRDGEDKEAENNDEGVDAMDAEDGAESNHQFNFADLRQRDDEDEESEDSEDTVFIGCDNHHVSHNLGNSGSDQFEVVDNMSRQIDAISISDVNEQPHRPSAAAQAPQMPPHRPSLAGQAQQIKEDHYILPVLKAMLKVPHDERVKVFRAAFPKVKDHEVSKVKLNSHKEIRDVWHLHRNHTKMFELDDATKSSDSPLSSSYVPRLRMFHKFVLDRHANGNGYNRPPPFSAIPPTEDIYKCGGPIMRVAVPNSNAIEDIMICNDAFCPDCAFAAPPTGDPDYNLHSMPFIHAEYLNAEDTSTTGIGMLADVQFEAGGVRDLATVPGKALRMTEPINVLFLDGRSRATVVCDVSTCEKCKNGTGVGGLEGRGADNMREASAETT